MSTVSIRSIESEARVNRSTHTEPDYGGPYRVHADLLVYADSHEEAVRIVERRLDGNESAEE